MVQPEHHSQGEDLEESVENVSRGEGPECEGQEGGQTAVENCRADGDESIDCFLQSVTWSQLSVKSEDRMLLS